MLFGAGVWGRKLETRCFNPSRFRTFTLNLRRIDRETSIFHDNLIVDDGVETHDIRPHDFLYEGFAEGSWAFFVNLMGLGVISALFYVRGGAHFNIYSHVLLENSRKVTEIPSKNGQG